MVCHIVIKCIMWIQDKENAERNAAFNLQLEAPSSPTSTVISEGSPWELRRVWKEVYRVLNLISLRYVTMLCSSWKHPAADAYRRGLLLVHKES
jgi:hypothetical protein